VRLPPLLAVAYALPFGSILLLPPLIQLSLHGLQGEPGVMLGRRRSMRPASVLVRAAPERLAVAASRQQPGFAAWRGSAQPA
jgi:hypothetical protein